MTIADLKKKAESGAYVDNNARELDTFKAKYSKPKTPAQAELGNPAQINPNVLSGMDVLNAQTGKANAPVEVEAAAGASLKKAGLTDAYNEWLDRTITANAEALTPYLKARRDWQDLYSVNRGDIYAFRDVYRNKVLNTAENAKQALKLNDEQLEDIYERTKLNPLEELNYYSGRALSGAASSVAGAAQIAAALPYYGLSVAGGLVDRTAEAAGGSTQFENFFSDTAKNIMTGDPLGANRFANYVNGLVKGKYLSQTQQTISNLAENAGAMIPAIATGNIAGMLGATAAGAEAANFAVFGSGAAGNATQRAMQEGADIGTALSYGVMSGMVEVITEKMFAGIAGMNKSGVIDDLIKGLERNGTMHMLVDTLGEGVEEIVAEVIDPFLKRATYDQNATNADLKDLLEAAKSGVLLSLIMNGAGIAMRGGDISALMGSTEGMTEAETLRNDKYGRLGKTDIGMVDDTLNNYNQRIDDILNADRKGAVKGLIRSGLSGQEGGEAYNLAWDMRQRYAEGEDLTGGELRQLYKANDNEIRQENDAEIERLAKGLAPSLSAALIDNYDNTTSPARYYLEMKNAYNAAQKGEAYKGDFLNANQISAAMQAAQSTQNNVAQRQNTGYNLLSDDYIRQMIEKGEIPNVGKQSSSTNAGRENNLATVEQGGGLEARAGEAKGRRPGSFEAQRAAKIAANAEVQRAGKVSGQEIHLRGTSSEKSFKVIPRSVWSQDESLDKIAQNYKKRGMNVVFIYGNIGLEGGGYARGAHRGNVMYINIADGEATAEQIAAHEYFHDFLDRYAQTGAKAFKKSADEARSWAVQQLVKKIRNTYGDGIDELMSVYAETYFTDEDGNITVSADYILEEILCDAAADIDILAGRKAETQRAPLYGETVREELNRMDEAVTRADTDDGGEKFSRKKENNNNRAETGNQEETPEQDADSGDEHYSRVTDQNTRFSMASPIEETDRLVALHNINSDGLAGALELGGLAMPSFAVMNAGTIQRGYGDITIVASKDSINPKSNDTSIYAGDAWTPTFPDVGIKIREDAAEAAESKVRALLEKAGCEKDYSLALDADNLQDQITRWGSFEKAYGDKDEFKVAFLQDTGRGIKIPKMEKAYTQKADLATLRKVAQEVELDKANNYEAAMGYEPVIRRLIREYRIEKYGEKLADKLSPADKPLSFSDVDDILHAAREFMWRGITEQVDTKELRARLDAAMSDEGTSAEYQAWLKKLSKDFIERRGIRNNKDLFTPSGNRRSFDQLYDAYTLANIVKAMKGQAKQGRTQFLSGSSSVKGAALKDFKDIEQVRSERNRLISELDENGKAAFDTFSENTKNLANKIADDPFTGSEILAEVLSHAKTKTAIESYLRREYDYLHSQDGLDLSQIAEEIYELGQEANTLPIEYFEAKLYRAFPLDEALAYIVPDSIDADLKAALENEGLNVIEYETGNQEDRIDKINSVEGARFSRVTPQQDADYLAAVERGDMETAQRMVDEAAEAAGYKKEVYHGTSAGFTVFREYGGNEIGYHVGTKAAADERIRDAKDTRVLRLYTKLGNKIQMPDVFGLWHGVHDYVSYVLGEPISDEDLDFLLNVKKATAKYKNADIFKKNKAFYEMRDKVKDAVVHEYKRSYVQEAVKAQREYMLSLGIDTVAYKNRYEDAGNTSYMLFHANQVKSADPVTYDDAGNVIPLSERFNSENDDIRFSRVIYDEQAKKEHAEKAIQHFGKTYNWNEVGYITQDGTRIDFSGKHDGAPGGYRTVDHRDISDALGLDYGGEDYSGAMLQFMSEGNIRISPESGGINVMIEPTKAQYERLSDFISRNRGEVIFDVDSEDGTPAYSAEWSKGTHSNKVIEDIKDYFQNGAKPKRSLIAEFHSQFSRVTPQQDADYLAAVERGDTQTAQRMVDEAAEAAMMYSMVRKNKVGALRRVYHYTDGEFTKFTSMPQSKGSNRTLGDGYYVSTDENEFSRFGKNKMVMYANITNPFEMSLTAEQAQEVYDKYFKPHHADKFHTYEPHALSKLQSHTGVFDYLKEAAETNNTTTSVILTELGFDGVHNGIEWVAFNSNQLKSADPVTYDDNGDAIPLSERFNSENDDIRYSRATPEESTIARLEKENAKLRERAEYWQKQTKLTKPKILNHKGVGKIASDLLTEYDSVSDHKELHAALFKLGNEILRGREEGHALTWERVTERAETLARDILNNSRVLINTDEYQEYNELKKYLKDNKIRYQNDGNIPDFPAWRKQHKGLNLRQNEGTPADIAYNELRERFGNALFPEDIVNPADQVIRMGEVLNGFEPIFENPYSYDMALAVEETADDIIDRLLNAAEDKSFADKQEERYQALKADSTAKLNEAKEKAKAKQAEAIKALKADSAAKLSEAKAKQAEAINALKADNAARLREVREQRDDKIKTLKEYYAAAKRDRAEAKADSEARSRLLRIVKRLKNRKLPAATRAMLDGYIADIDTVAKSITGKSIEKLSELREWYTEQIENNPNFVRDEGIEKALQRLSNRKIGDMSAEEVADLTNVLLGIEHEIREHNKFIESEYKRNIYEAGAQTVMDLQDVKGASLPKLNKLETEMLSPIRAIHRFVGYKDDSPLMIFANELNEGQHKMLDYQRKAYEAFNQFLEDKDFMKSLTGKHATKIKVQGITPTGEAGEAYISPAMRIALVAHAMNPQNMKHIVDGGVTIPDFDLYNKGKQAEAYSRNTRLRFTKSQLEGIAATLTPKERAFLNAVMTYFNVTSRKAINETSEALKGYSLADVENYFPINSDDAFLKNDFESLKFDGTIEGMGFLKDRIRGAANPIYLRDVVTVLNKAIEQHSRYYGLAVPLRNFNKLWNVNTRGATQDLQFDEENRPYTEDGDVINGYISSVKDAMRRAWFDAGENYIEKLVKDLSGVHKQPETFEKLLNMVRSNYAKAVLTLNLGVAVKQTASYPTAAAVLGWRPLARAMADIGRVNMDTINKYTPVQYYRSRGYSTQELGDLAARGKSLPKALNWIQGMDVVTTRKLWKASEYYVRRANRDLAVGSPAYYNAVAAIYNRVIEETQPNYTTMQRPGLLRSESALLQSLMMFKTQPFQNFNILSDSLGNLAAKRRAWKAMGTPEAKAAYKEAKRTAVRAVTSQFVANAVFVGMAAAWALFRGKTKDYKDDDDEYTWKSVMSKIGRDMVGTAAGMVPFGSEFWELVQSLAFGDTYYGIETVTASALSDAGSAIKKAWNSTATIIDDVKNPDKEANWNKYVFQMESVVNAISKLVGVPFENVTKLLKAVTLRAANVICDDEYESQYVALRISTDPVTDSGAYIDNLYKAKTNGAKSYTELYNLMVNAGISEDKIKAGMEKRMKAAEGVEKVGDLDERYLAPKQETIYQKALRELEQSDTYKAATDEQKKGAKSDLYDLYAQTADGKKMREKIDEGKNYDVSDTDYIEFLLSLHEHDEPTENDNYGSYTNEEIIAALKAMDITNKERAYLYSTKNSNKSNNPWARYLPR